MTIAGTLVGEGFELFRVRVDGIADTQAKKGPPPQVKTDVVPI